MLSLGAHGISGLWGGKCFCRVQSSKTAFRQIVWKKARKPSVRYNQDISRYHLHFGKLIKVQRRSHFTSERWLTSVPRTPTPSWSKYSLTCAEPKTAKINRNMIWFDKSRVCPRANKVLTPISGTVQNASAAYLSLWWLHRYSKAGGKAVECEWVSGNTSPLGSNSFVLMGYDPYRVDLWTWTTQNPSNAPPDPLVRITRKYFGSHHKYTSSDCWCGISFLKNDYYPLIIWQSVHCRLARCRKRSLVLTRNNCLSSRSFCSISKQCQ